MEILTLNSDLPSRVFNSSGIEEILKPIVESMQALEMVNPAVYACVGVLTVSFSEEDDLVNSDQIYIHVHVHLIPLIVCYRIVEFTFSLMGR